MCGCTFTKPTYNDEPMLAPCNAHTYLMWVSDKPKVLIEPASVSSDQLGVKLITRHGPNKGEDYQWELTACVRCAWGRVGLTMEGMRWEEEVGVARRGRHAEGSLLF